MKNLLACALGASVVMCGWVAAPAAAAVAAASPAPLDFHLFESTYARRDAVADGYAQVRAALPAGVDQAAALATLRRAGAQCQAPRGGRTTLDCFYRETISVDDYATTTATWDVRLSLADGKLAAISVERTAEQR